MTKPQLEHWARSIIDRIKAGQRVEDDRVDVKADWPSDHRKIARRIAATANAASYEPILYLIGANEDNHTVTGAGGGTDVAEWYSQVEKHFDSHAPQLHVHSFEADGKAIYALQFDTDAPPYVVLTGIAGEVTHEVPWRSGTRTNTANRGNLLRILVPIERLPTFEVLQGDFRVELQPVSVPGRDDPFRWSGHVGLYIVPRETSTCLIHHKSAAYVSIEKQLARMELNLRLETGYKSATVTENGKDLLVNGPGIAIFTFDATTKEQPVPNDCFATIDLRIGIAGQQQPVNLQLELMPINHPSEQNRYWSLIL